MSETRASGKLAAITAAFARPIRNLFTSSWLRRAPSVKGSASSSAPEDYAPVTALTAREARLRATIEQGRLRTDILRLRRHAEGHARVEAFLKPWRRWGLGALGVTLGVLLAGRVALLVLPSSPVESVHATQVGESKHLRLANGAFLSLNTHTKVRVRSEAGKISIDLERGELWVCVGNNPRQSLVIRSGNSEVEAPAGSELSLRAMDQSQTTYVLVAAGKPRLTAARSARELAAGHSVWVTPEFVTAEHLAPQRIHERHAWLRGELIFFRETLADVVAEVNRYNFTQLVIKDPSIAHIRIGGTYRPTDLVSFLSALGQLSGVSSSYSMQPGTPEVHIHASPTPRALKTRHEIGVIQ